MNAGRYQLAVNKLRLLIDTLLVWIMFSLVLALRFEQLTWTLACICCRSGGWPLRQYQANERRFVVVEIFLHSLVQLVVRRRSSHAQHVHDVVRILTVHLIEHKVVLRLPRVIRQTNLEEKLVAEPLDQEMELILHLVAHSQRVRLLLMPQRREVSVEVALCPLEFLVEYHAVLVHIALELLHLIRMLRQQHSLRVLPHRHQIEGLLSLLEALLQRREIVRCIILRPLAFITRKLALFFESRE